MLIQIDFRYGVQDRKKSQILLLWLQMVYKSCEVTRKIVMVMKPSSSKCIRSFAKSIRSHPLCTYNTCTLVRLKSDSPTRTPKNPVKGYFVT